MKKILIRTLETLALPVVVYLIFLAIIPERFGNWNCFYTIFLQSIIPTITAYAIAFGNICGLFDFSIGSEQIISAVGMVLGAFISALFITLLTGILNSVFRIPSLVLTMGLAMIYEIVGSKLAGHYGFVQIDTEHAIFGSSPEIVIIFIAMLALFYFLFNHTVFGYNLRAVGSNETVAKASGVDVRAVKIKAFFYGDQWEHNRVWVL